MSKLLSLSKLKLQSAFVLLTLMVSGLPAAAQLGGVPTFILPPLGLSVQEGGTATILPATIFTLTKVTAYQWYFNSTNKIAYGTNASLVIPNISSQDGGKYTVTAKNSTGWSAQSPAALLVIIPVVNVVTNVVTQVLNVASATMSSAGFQLNFNNVSNSTCIVYASSNLVDWTPICTNAVSGGKASCVDTNASSHAFRYYKAISQ